jgi:hypothetical protein
VDACVYVSCVYLAQIEKTIESMGYVWYRVGDGLECPLSIQHLVGIGDGRGLSQHLRFSLQFAKWLPKPVASDGVPVASDESPVDAALASDGVPVASDESPVDAALSHPPYSARQMMLVE